MNNTTGACVGLLVVGLAIGCGKGTPASARPPAGPPCEAMAPATRHATWAMQMTWDAPSPECAGATDIPWDAPLLVHVIPEGPLGNYSQTEKTQWATSEIRLMGSLGEADNADGVHCLYSVGVNNLGHATAESPAAFGVFQVFVVPGQSTAIGTATIERAAPATFGDHYDKGPGYCARKGTVALTISPV